MRFGKILFGMAVGFLFAAGGWAGERPAPVTLKFSSAGKIQDCTVCRYAFYRQGVGG